MLDLVLAARVPNPARLQQLEEPLAASKISSPGLDSVLGCFQIDRVECPILLDGFDLVTRPKKGIDSLGGGPSVSGAWMASILSFAKPRERE
jgi:hypothetical protein